jgi:16S rRNA (guanine(1405)-N(7))-methyltransferase
MKILNKEINEKILSKIVDDIKDKPQFREMNVDFVKDLLKKELEKNSKLLDFVINHDIRTIDRSEKYKKLVKSVRTVLHKSYGVFLTHESKRIKELILDLKESIDRAKIPMDSIEAHKAVLNTHVSTRERLEIYPRLYWHIWTITGKPRKIIDLASGLNPISFPWMGLNNVDYLATEINKADCDLINEYFERMRKFQLFGLAVPLDLQQILKTPELLKSLPQSDVCFLFKVLDTIELTKSHKISELIISTIPTRWVIVSFPIKTITKKAMSSTRHAWLEKMCQRLGYKFKRLIMANESFYIINTTKPI